MPLLSAKEQDFCTYAGIFGSLLTAACALQHFVIYKVFDYILPALMLLVYVITVISFILLALQKWYAPICLLVSAVLSILNGVMAMAGPVFSLLPLLQFIGTGTIVILIYVDGLPGSLKARELALRAEQDEWSQIL